MEGSEAAVEEEVVDDHVVDDEELMRKVKRSGKRRAKEPQPRRKGRKQRTKDGDGDGEAEGQGAEPAPAGSSIMEFDGDDTAVTEEVRNELLHITDAMMQDPLTKDYRELPKESTTPEFIQTVKKPICLRIVRERLVGNEYPTIAHFMTDMRRVFYLTFLLYPEEEEEGEVAAYLLEKLQRKLDRIWDPNPAARWEREVLRLNRLLRRLPPPSTQREVPIVDGPTRRLARRLSKIHDPLVVARLRQRLGARGGDTVRFEFATLDQDALGILREELDIAGV